MKISILVLDDEEGIRRDLSRYLMNQGYEVFVADTIEHSNEIIQSKRIDFEIIDLKIDYSSEYGGIKVNENINKIQPKTANVILTAYERNPEIDSYLEKVTYSGYIPKGGAVNYI